MSKIPTFGKIQKGVSYVDRPGAYGFLRDSQARLAIVETTFGFFLPGGGIEGAEAPEAALSREIFEEIGFTVTSAQFVLQAEQFHWSEFYKKHFRKIGSFYHVEATPPPARYIQAEHALVWWDVEKAVKMLSQEFQRWAVGHVLAKT